MGKDKKYKVTLQLRKEYIAEVHAGNELEARAEAISQASGQWVPQIRAVPRSYPTNLQGPLDDKWYVIEVKLDDPGTD